MTASPSTERAAESARHAHRLDTAAVADRGRRWRRRALWTLGVAAAAWGAWRLLQPDALTVETRAAVVGTLRSTLSADGQTTMRERVTVTAPVGGMLGAVSVDAGDRVQRGQVLATITAGPPTPLDARLAADARGRWTAANARVAQAVAALEEATTRATAAERALQRARALSGAGAVAPRDTEDAAQAAEAARLLVRSTRDALRAAQAERDAAAASVQPSASVDSARAVPVRAPIDGVVLRVATRGRSLVAPTTPLLDLADPSTLEVAVDLLTTDAARVPVGARADVFGWSGGEGGERLAAHVVRVDPGATTRISALGVEEQRTTVVLALDDGGAPSRPRSVAQDGAQPRTTPALGDGFRVEVEIVLSEQPGVLQVPASALVRDPGGWAVFVVEGDRARRRSVVPGARGGGATAIERGLDAGAVVVLYPGDDVRDGTRVRLAR